MQKMYKNNSNRYSKHAGMLVPPQRCNSLKTNLYRAFQIMPKIFLLMLIFTLTSCGRKSSSSDKLGTRHIRVDSRDQWINFIDTLNHLDVSDDGQLIPDRDSAFLSSQLIEFEVVTRLDSILLTQSPKWNNWKKIPRVRPDSAEDAPVLIAQSPNHYWLLSSYHGDFENGYHAWFSDNMYQWTHYGPVTSYENRWVTTAEYVNGQFYIYFDKPNDEDPHLIIDRDLTDGKFGEEKGLVFNDPSHGSDVGIIRDIDGFHMIYEDWSPLNPRKHSWDSPLAGHSDSPDGITGFLPHEHKPPIDMRTPPTDSTGTYEPHKTQLDPRKDLGPYTYEMHEEPQDSYGDYSIIKVGTGYYLFCDYDPGDEEKSMRVGRWYSDDIKKQFTWDGEIGEGFHPDPTIGFAEGRFFLLVQRSEYDFVSPGPWVDQIFIRAGVDTDHDGKIDQWTKFEKIKEAYKQKPGYTKVIEVKQAVFSAESLPPGWAFKIEIMTGPNNSLRPVINTLETWFTPSN